MCDSSDLHYFLFGRHISPRLHALTNNQTKLRIRLLGIDAPDISHGKEPGQPFCEESRDYLDHLNDGKTIRMDAYGPDRYRRILTILWDERINVNRLMVAMGFAEICQGASCQVYCRELDNAEAKARHNRVGMWAQGASHEGPRAFRQRNH